MQRNTQHGRCTANARMSRESHCTATAAAVAVVPPQPPAHTWHLSPLVTMLSIESERSRSREDDGADGGDDQQPKENTRERKRSPKRWFTGHRADENESKRASQPKATQKGERESDVGK